MTNLFGSNAALFLANCFNECKALQIAAQPPPSSIAPCPTSQLSRCAVSNTTSEGNSLPN